MIALIRGDLHGVSQMLTARVARQALTVQGSAEAVVPAGNVVPGRAERQMSTTPARLVEVLWTAATPPTRSNRESKR